MRASLLIFALTLGLCEGSCRLFHFLTFPTYALRGGTAFERDPQLGITLKPNLSDTLTVSRRRSPLYEVGVHTDARGRRVTPRPPGATKHALFFGCSFTFGLGVEDDQTLPAFFSRHAPEYAAYNYGIPGAGPQSMLARLQSPGMRSEIAEPERDGVLVYTFIDDHVFRAIGSPTLYFGLGKYLPYYHWNNRLLVHDGDFSSGRPGYSLVASLAAHSYLLFYLMRVAAPRLLGPDDLSLVATILDESRRVYLQKFGSDRFYVVFYPGSGAYPRRLIPKLAALGIRYLDYSRLDFSAPTYRLPIDWHPSGLAYRELARRLAKDLSAPVRAGR